MGCPDEAREQGSTPPWATDAAAARLGRFILGPELGRGGMGVVHRAWDSRLLREVALKLVSLPDPVLYLRFLREAEHQARVEHPHVCQIYEVGVEAEVPFIAMRLIPGASLQAVGPGLPHHVLARLMAQAASALQAAHEAGLIHRDVKPSNILLEPQPTGGLHPYLMDFGLALDDHESRLTQGLGSPGTPAFMSPEQARGLEPVGPRSDLYSLGASFRPLFLGQEPWQGPTVPSAGRKDRPAQGPPGRPESRAPRKLHQDLEAILRKCQDPDPDRRYPSALALEQDLDRWLEGRPTLARPVGPLGRITRLLRRRRALVLALGLAALCAALPTAWGLRHRWTYHRQLVRTERFANDLAELGRGLRKERMLPLHDIRPAEERLRKRMEELRQALPGLGPQAQGPGLTALGIGHLELRDFKAAETLLDQAWKDGHHSPVLALARGKVLAETYLTHSELALDGRETGQRKDLPESLRRELVEPSLAALRQAGPTVSEPIAYLEALEALLNGDELKCVARCQEAIRQAPWFYEALYLEGRVQFLRMLRSNPLRNPDPAVSREAFVQARRALGESLRLAPSDDRGYTALVRLHIVNIVTQGASGNHFDEQEGMLAEARKVADNALAIRPQDLQALLTWLDLQCRYAESQGMRGMDGRLVLREARARALAWLGGREPEGPMRRCLGILDTMLGQQLFLHGDDSREVLEEGARFFGDGIGEQGMLRSFLALDALRRGEEPWRYLDDAEAALDRCLAKGQKALYLQISRGLVLEARGRAELETGRDPQATLRRNREIQQRTLRKARGSLSILLLLLVTHELEIQRAEALGEDSRPSRKARQACLRLVGARVTAWSELLIHKGYASHDGCPCQREGLQLTPEVLEAIARQHRETRRVLELTIRTNVFETGAHLALASLNRDEARLDLLQGRSPRAHLEAARNAIQRVLDYQAVDAHHWVALAQVHAQWALAIPAEADRHWALASASLDKAQALLPRDRHVRAERLLQQIQREGADPASLRQLEDHLKANPFLGRVYRNYLRQHR